MQAATSRRLINLVSIVTLIASVAVSIYWLQQGVFQNPQALQSYLGASGWMGAVFFVLIQIIQVVIPIIPGGISTAAGVLIFGPVWGFVYNYVGIVVGSLINFLLARRYGQAFILHVVSPKTYQKYTHWLDHQQKFDWFFGLAILAPVAPDDILCLIAGLTKMSFKKFTWIILLAKPATILTYSLALVYGSQWLSQLF
ncbi:hypothetical protein IV38_GL001692 [Lactobacillus selangorensis]|uniref:TVP38/TMEM64 family membrane protein n=1 Tax=Lactobacillus selangorensis TaxID=81857 RepID=A0A0R2FIY6_9LACO|nr:VTT domain-containing protein [Lactobacillus selangorensis]KRN28238.1 hypothetical protein IV38_GL001692 [Lactobacillus selangorensis]KRN30886.1 hypothetical protein IV40_GL001523 [Lactobacillus selangorensis]